MFEFISLSFWVNPNIVELNDFHWICSIFINPMSSTQTVYFEFYP